MITRYLISFITDVTTTTKLVHVCILWCCYITSISTCIVKLCNPTPPFLSQWHFYLL